ncbi:MAG: cbb3-type cytochrome c oxidase subunit 3 [Gammaproteobacteria bacterium]|nr:cbb3-type cytochrome c oxidase subunit 3 [Gammaproteobacteria bacterium]
MDIILFHSIWTVALLALFVGIWVWAWSAKRRSSFDEAARLALDDDDMTQAAERGEKNNG